MEESEDDGETDKEDNDTKTSDNHDDRYELAQEILNKPLGFWNNHTEGILSDSEYSEYEFRIVSYIKLLAEYYNTGETPNDNGMNLFDYLEKGSDPYNTIVSNYNSGDFSNYELNSVDGAYRRILDAGDGLVYLEITRDYKHKTSSGWRNIITAYVMDKDTKQILGWKEIGNVSLSDDEENSDATFGLTDYGNTSLIDGPEASLVDDYLQAISEYYNTGDSSVSNFVNANVFDLLRENHSSGNFTDYQNITAEIVNVQETEFSVFVEVYREYSHATSGGSQSNSFIYEVRNGVIVGWTEAGVGEFH